MKTKFYIFLLITLLLFNFYFTKQSYSVYSSSRIYPSYFPSTYQFEPIIFISPLNPMIMFCSAYTVDSISTFKSEGIYVTTDGGLSWRGDDSCTGGNILNHGGDPGIVIDKNGVFILYHIGNIQTGVFTNYSTNQGYNWSSQFTISQSVPPEDKGSITTDNIQTSPFYGRSYASWVNYQPPYPVLFSYTTNSGVSWAAYTQINPSPPQRCSGGEIKTGPNGKIYVAWAGVNSNIPPVENYAGFAISTNGGASWNFNQSIFSMNGIGGFLSTKGNILVNGLPRMAVDLTGGSRNGYIYIVTNEINHSPAGSDPDIVFHRSTDEGQSWSQGIRVNQDPLNNGKIQYFPAICVDSTGGINILYYDDRLTTSDSTDVFLSRSIDGGNTWTDFQISDKRFKPRQYFGTTHFQGDFISIASARNKLFPFWMASYAPVWQYQIYTTIIDMPIGIQKIGNSVPKEFILKQNYPNPFNPSTTIEFSLPKKENVKLIIYNELGEEIKESVYSNLEPGVYKTEFKAENLPSGVYFYQLKTDSYSKTRKMMIVK